MKKKIGLLLCVLVLALGLTACGSEKETLTYDEATLEQYTDTVLQSFEQMTDTDFESLKEASDLELGITLMNSGLPVESDNFITMMEAWQAATSEYGELEDYSDYEVEATDKDVTLTTKANFENKDADIVFVFDEKLNIESMTVDIHYTMGQILEKAGLNTLLGMGTVFAVLIFISLLISSFKFIPAIEAKFKKQKTEAKPAAAPKTPVVSTPAAPATAANDGELIAVIAAAIAASEGTTTDGFIVRSIKRRTTNKWN
ncbi:MAG: OadG family transporter subunit [Hespellia sp.]|nr:OadG family transporter subunit [Hespellia sp.]